MAKTSKPMMVIHNAETNEYTEREYTDEELAREKELKDQHALRAKAEADKAAILARLGLTEDELKTILG